MLKLWPQVHADEHGDQVPQAELLDGLSAAACLARQSVQLEPQPTGWKIIIDSAVETGRVELFVPRDRTEPSRIVVDTRAASTLLPFETLYISGHYAEAVVVAERELQDARLSGATAGGATSPENRTLVAKLLQVGMACLRQGDYERTESAVDEAIPICEAASTEYGETLIRLLHIRVTARYLYRCVDEESTLDVRRELTRQRQRAGQLLGPEHPETARIMTSQARLLISEFSYPEAEELLTEALRIQRAAPGGQPLYVAEALLELARLNAYREDHIAADELFQQAIAIRETQCGPHHPDVAEALFHYTDFLMYNVRDGAKAGALLRRALAIWDETIGLDHSLIVRETEFIRKVLSIDTETATASV